VLLVIAVTSLFYIVYRLIVVYIVVVDYLVSKCDSEAARGKLNSLSDPRHPWGRFRARSIIVSYRIVLSFCYRIVSYCTKGKTQKMSKERSVQPKVRKKKREDSKRMGGTY
jgi:hypothetical protein